MNAKVQTRFVKESFVFLVKDLYYKATFTLRMNVQDVTLIQIVKDPIKYVILMVTAKQIALY